MKILLAPDKFKGSLTAQQVCDALREGLLSKNVDIEIVSIPLADGGEGTDELLTSFSKGREVKVRVLDPLFREIDSGYGISGDGSTVFIEMARASGLQLLSKEERNPRMTTTFGTGQLIRHALENNATKIVLGIGGSATNDAGLGMAAALGFRFLSKEGLALSPVGDSLKQVASINDDEKEKRISEAEFIVIFDVKNPFYGIDGAAHVFAKQKGASLPDINYLDEGLRHFASVVHGKYKSDINFPGSGAGGGMSGAAKVFLNATFTPGIDFVMNFTNIEARIREADLVITGEGRIDDQTLSGKVVKGIASLASQHRKKCVAFCGQCHLPAESLEEMGVNKVVQLMRPGYNEQHAIKNAFSLLKQAAGEAL